MANRTAIQDWLRWLARAISALAAGFWLFILLDIVACDALVGFVCLNWEMALLGIIVAVSLISTILAWRGEGFGVILLAAWGVIFTVFAAIDSKTHWTMSVLMSGVPFLIAGLLYLAGRRPREQMVNS